LALPTVALKTFEFGDMEVAIVLLKVMPNPFICRIIELFVSVIGFIFLTRFLKLRSFSMSLTE
jgi:hypothetical protein